MTRNRVFPALAFLIVVLAAYLLAWPLRIDPVSWTPPPAPELTGTYARNSELSGIERLSVNAIGPEDVAIDSEGGIYCGVNDGRIFRLQSDGTHPEVFADTHGRPLGLAFDRDGNLIVADAIKGLLSIDQNKTISVLTTAANGLPFGCTNDLDVAQDGTVYFSDSSFKFPLSQLKADLLEHRGNGRLLAYDPHTKQTRTLLRDLYFANGVAVSPDQSFVLVAETGAYQIRRFWLSGARRGQSDIFIDNLPGFPDGILSNGRDLFWLAIVTPRDTMLDKLLPHPFLRKVVMRLPTFLQPDIRHYAFVIALDQNGVVVRNLQDSSPTCFSQIANVVEHEGKLYFGSIGETGIGRMSLTLIGSANNHTKKRD